MNDLHDRLKNIQHRILAAEQKFNRPAGSVSLLAVSKGHDFEAIARLAQAGQSAFGENTLQEALQKISALAAISMSPPPHWHFLGKVQTNKTRDIAQHFSWVHSVYRAQEATALSKYRSSDFPPLNICLQIKLDPRPHKLGIAPDLHEINSLIDHILTLPTLRLRGLMSLPPYIEDPAEQQAYFHTIKILFESLKKQHPTLALDTLSMGMTHDFESAIAQGATWVRIGTAIFGPRNQEK